MLTAKRPTLILLLTLCLMALPLTAMGERASVAETEQVAANFMSAVVAFEGDWAGSTAPSVSRVEEVYQHDTLVGYCYHVLPSGYVVVPLLKELAPVVVSSETSHFDVNAADGMAAMTREMLLSGVRAFMQHFGSLDAAQDAKSGTPFGTEYRSLWDSYTVKADDFRGYLSAQSKAEGDTVVVGPLTTSTWHQGDPYNLYCPQGDGGRCIVGCVATAAAQIMHFYQWPPFGSGTASYFWTGDDSCDPDNPTPGRQLTVDVSDGYDWAHIKDDVVSYSSDEDKAATAELNYEVGVAFEMFYGRCASGAYVKDGRDVFPTYFRYKDIIQLKRRYGFDTDEWCQLAYDELTQGRVISYRITSHAIVLDGWRNMFGWKQLHFNYGWDDGHNAWYTPDAMYCPWGCEVGDQLMLTNIVPDREIMFHADTTIGWVPFDVQFSGESELDVDSWAWAFGDGDFSAEQSPLHRYEQPGHFDVTLSVESGEYNRTLTRSNYVLALADSIRCLQTQSFGDGTAIVTLSARNSAPVRRMEIPVSYAGQMDLVLDSVSADGCRTAYFEHVSLLQSSPSAGLCTVRLEASAASGQPELEPGSGAILKLYFTIDDLEGPGGKSAPIDLSGYSYFRPMFYGSILDYSPRIESGQLFAPCCTERGDFDSSGGAPDVVDLSILTNYMFREGQPPSCLDAADIDGDHFGPDITDLVTLVNFMFRESGWIAPCGF